MAYITLEELKKILPGILDQWIDEDDESWEWIFQEIEQKCHVGKKEKKKDQKKWKKKLVSMVDTHSTVLSAHRNDINKLNKKFEYYEDALKKFEKDVMQLRAKMDVISCEAKEAKFAAQTAKQRTEVDYTQASRVKYNGVVDCIKEETHVSEAQVAQNIYNRMVNRGATREELDSFREVIKKYDATSYSWNKEAKENE